MFGSSPQLKEFFFCTQVGDANLLANVSRTSLLSYYLCQ